MALPRANVRLLLDGTSEAEKALLRDAERHPTYADARYRLGLLFLVRGEYERALREFEDALGIHSDYRAAQYAVRLVRMLRGEKLDEPPLLPAGVVAPDESLWCRVDEAYMRMTRGEEPGAIYENPPTACARLVNLHYEAGFAAKVGDLDRARAALEVAAAESETSREVLRRAGVVPWRPEAIEEIDSYLTGLVWSPLVADLYSYVGRIYARNGLAAEALEFYGKAFLLLPRPASYAMSLAEMACASGNEEESARLLTQAVEMDPTFVPARIALGFEYAAQGFAEEARTQFEVAAKLAPGYADVRYNLALLYASEGREEEAVEQLRAALGINPGYISARRALGWILCRMGRYEEGLAEYERLLRRGFQSPDILVQMGRAAIALERIDEALEYLQRASNLSPDYAPAYFYLGQAYQKRGLRNRARAAWRRYLERSEESSHPGDEA